MPDTKDKPLSQQYHETVEALKAEGVKNADAIREVAKRFNKSENAIRGGIHQFKSAHISGPTSTAGRARRKAQSTVEDYLANARKSLEDALALIDDEVEQAKQRLDEAQANYDKVTADVKARKDDVLKKIKALS